MQAEDERGHAVGEPYCNDAEWPAGVEREPHQGDVVQRVAQFARRDGQVDVTKVAAPEQADCFAWDRGAETGSSSSGIAVTGRKTRPDPAAPGRVRLAEVTAIAMRDGSLVAAVSADAGALA